MKSYLLIVNFFLFLHTIFFCSVPHHLYLKAALQFLGVGWEPKHSKKHTIMYMYIRMGVLESAANFFCYNVCTEYVNLEN